MRQKNRLNNKDLALRQTKFIQALQGIGDVLVFETKRRNRNKNVIQGLKRIEKIVKEFFAIQKEDPDKFEHLLLAQDFFKLFREDEKEAKLRLAFDPDKYLVSFSTAVNQILRIHEAAIETKNDEISRFATYYLNWLLADISQIPKNDLFVEQLLKNLAGMTRIDIEKQNRSMYAASVHWYIDIVFNRLRQKEGGFDLSYLTLFDRYFFSSVKYIVSENQTSLFEALISSLVDGVHIPTYYEGKVWDYGHLILHSDFHKYEELDKDHKIENRIKELAESEKDLDTKEKLDKWLEKFDEFKKILEPNISKERKEEAKRIEDEIKEFVVSQYKYNNLLEIVFAIGAYCLFKQKFGYIKYLWEYKQPPDSDASWIGHDIIPDSIDDIISFYFRKGLFERRFDFWEDHHGSETYYKKYFLLLLSRMMQTISSNSEGKYEQIENYNLPKLHIYRLSDLEYSIDEFIGIANDIKGQTDILGNLGFDTTKVDETFNKKVIPFLQGLKIKAQERIKSLQREQQISPKKIEEFREQLLKEFNETVVLRNIFKHYKLFEDKTSEKYDDTLERFGINIVTDKAAFFEEWHVHYTDWGGQYGRNLAAGEDSHLLEGIIVNCKEIKKNEFEQILEKFSDLSDVIIFVTNMALYKFFENSKNFKPKWYKDSPQLDVKGFEGWYLYKGKYLPIFRAYHRKIDEQIAILNKSKLGKLIQYSPLDEGENEGLKKDIFYMDIRAFSEDENLMKKFLEKPPEWLEKIGDKNKQREHLREKVLLQIFERFEYNKHLEFEGYLLKIKDLEH